MLPPQSSAQTRAITLAGLAHCIIARVKVLSLLQLLAEEILLVRKLAIQSEELLLLFSEGLPEWSQSVCPGSCSVPME